MLIGYFDYLIFALLILLNIKLWKIKIKWIPFLILGGLLFGIVLPIISIIIELEIVKATTGEWMDNFEVVYTILRFPTYWIIGFVQLAFLILYSKNKRTDMNLSEPAGGDLGV